MSARRFIKMRDIPGTKLEINTGGVCKKKRKGIFFAAFLLIATPFPVHTERYLNGAECRVEILIRFALNGKRFTVLKSLVVRGLPERATQWIFFKAFE